MRLSDVRGERTLDVIADLVDPVANIATDSAVQSAVRDSDGDKIAMLRAMVPALLKDHRADVLAILSTIQGVTPDEYAEDMTLGSLLGDCYELVTDEGFLSFLSSQEKGE